MADKTYEITTPEGRKFRVTAPEGTSPEEIAAGVQQKIAGEDGFKGKARQVGGEIQKAARVATAILKRGATDVPKFFAGAIQSGGDWFEKRLPITPESMKYPMASAPEIIDRMTGGTPYQGQNVGERLAIEAGAGALGGAGLGAASKPTAIAGAIGGAGAGVGAEVGEMVDPGNPISRIVGAILGGGVTAPASYKVTGGGVSRRVAEVAGKVPDTKLAEGQQLMQQAKQEGINLNLPQAMEQPNPLIALSEDAARSSSAPQHTMLQAGQTVQAQAAAKKGMSLFNLPGADPVEVAFRTQQAAEAAVARAGKLPAKVAGAEYAFKVPKATPQEVKRVISDLQDEIERIGPTTNAGRYLQQEVLGKVIDKKNKSFITDMQQLKTILKEAESGIDKPTLNKPGMDKYSAGLAREGLKKLEDFVASKQIDPKTGDLIYQQAHEAIIDPMKRGPVGQIASPKGVDESIPTKVDAIFKVLDSPNIRAQTISKLQVDLDKSAPGTFAQYSKAAMERKLEAAFKQGAGETPLDAPAQFVKALRGGPGPTIANENFRATMAASARSLGKTPAQAAEFVTGMEKLMAVIEAAGRGKVIVTSKHGRNTAMDIATDIAKGTAYTPQAPGAASRIIQNFMGGDATRRKIFDLIWTPEGVDQIRKYAAMDIGAIRSSFLAGMVVPASSGE